MSEPTVEPTVEPDVTEPTPAEPEPAVEPEPVAVAPSGDVNPGDDPEDHQPALQAPSEVGIEASEPGSPASLMPEGAFLELHSE